MDRKIKIIAIPMMLLSIAITVMGATSEQLIRMRGRVFIPSCDTVTFVHYTFYAAGSRMFAADTSLVLDGAGGFNYEVDADHPVYIAVYPIVNGKKTIVTGNRNIFLAKPGDNVFLSLYTDTIKVKGKGSEKYKALIRISSPTYLEAGMALTASRKRQALGEMIREDFNQVDRMLDSLYTEKCRLLEQYRGRLTPEDYQLMAYDLEADYRNARISSLYLFSNSMKPETRRLIYEQTKPFLFPSRGADSVGSALKAYSRHYPTYLQRRLAYWSKTRIPGRLEPVELDLVFDEIIKNYSGLLRERLIMEYLLALKKNYNIDPYVTAAAEYIHEPVLRGALDVLDKAKRGGAFYTFNLPDSSGNYVNSERFQGKYLLIDFWFTGCLYCTVLKRRMADDVERWMRHPDFQMVSISIDKSSDVWKRSLAGGKYSHAGSIDTYTEGLGGDHPFIKYYSITAYPTLLLVSPDGKLMEIESGSFKRIGNILNEKLK